MKKLAFIFSVVTTIVISIIVIFVIRETHDNRIGNKIMKYIDENCDENSACIFTMDDIVDFKWDKLLMYDIGSSEKEISELLNVKFNSSVDMSVGMVFVYNNKIVYKERKTSNIELPEDLTFYKESEDENPQYLVNTPVDAIYKGIKKLYGGKYYYSISQISDNEVNKVD